MPLHMKQHGDKWCADEPDGSSKQCYEFDPDKPGSEQRARLKARKYTQAVNIALHKEGKI